MPLPETVRVKLSSEAAEALSLTSVVVHEMALRELVEMMLGVTGKQAERVHELLLRGTLVSGGSRLRWAGWDADRAALEALLGTFPDPDPGRPFAPAACFRAVLRGARARLEIPREVGTRRRWLRRGSFWEVLMELAAAGSPRYLEYSYRERADRYEMPIATAGAARLRAGAGMLGYSTLERQVREAAFETLEFFVAREG